MKKKGENKIKAPIKYFGGKGGMLKKIIEHFPPENSYNIYIEPFGGSFSIGIHKEIIPIEIYNDLDENVYSLYKCLSDKNLFEQFKERCDLTFYSENLRKEYKNCLKSNLLSLVDRAFYFFYINRTSHNGVGGLSINTVIRRNMSKSVSDMLSSIDRLPELHQRLSRLIVLNTDGTELIRKYNREGVFIYADPPYEQSTRTRARYKVDMTMPQHNNFLEVAIQSSAKILISGYDCPSYNRLVQNNFQKIQFEINTIDGNRKPKTKIETLWKNY
mgnify:CR=1 FL=1